MNGQSDWLVLLVEGVTYKKVISTFLEDNKRVFLMYFIADIFCLLFFLPHKQAIFVVLEVEGRNVTLYV